MKFLNLNLFHWNYFIDHLYIVNGSTRVLIEISTNVLYIQVIGV